MSSTRPPRADSQATICTSLGGDNVSRYMQAPAQIRTCGEAVPSVWFTFRTLQKSDSACYPEQGCCRSTPLARCSSPGPLEVTGEAEGPAAWVSPLFDKAQDFSYPFPLVRPINDPRSSLEGREG